jgi:AcrR family transcriptional regulator
VVIDSTSRVLSRFSSMATGETHTIERPLPRGPHRLTREAVLESQRGRMLDAIANAVADKGYAATTVGDVVSGAGVSRKTFYEHFSDKEECFLAAWDTGVQILFDAILAARDRVNTPIERMRAGLRAYLETLAAEPAFARSFFIEVVAAGPHAEARRAEVHSRFADLLTTLHEQARREMPQLPELPPAIPRAAVGAINELVSDYVRAGRTEQLPELEDTILHLQLVLFAGHDVAVRATRR